MVNARSRFGIFRDRWSSPNYSCSQLSVTESQTIMGNKTNTNRIEVMFGWVRKPISASYVGRMVVIPSHLILGNQDKPPPRKLGESGIAHIDTRPMEKLCMMCLEFQLDMHSRMKVHRDHSVKLNFKLRTTYNYIVVLSL
jgi:hypothetical protein